MPTAKELGITGLVPAGWFGLAAPKGTSPAILEKLQVALAASLKDPDTQRKLQELGWVVVGNTPAEALARARADYDVLGQVVRDIGLKPN